MVSNEYKKVMFRIRLCIIGTCVFITFVWMMLGLAADKMIAGLVVGIGISCLFYFSLMGIIKGATDHIKDIEGVKGNEQK